MSSRERRTRPAPSARPRLRAREAKSSRGPLIAIVVACGALALLGIVWLATHRGEGGAAAGNGRSRPSSGSTPSREVIVVSVPTSYSDSSVGQLAGELRASNLRTRMAAANALAALGPRAREAIPALLNAMARPSSEIEFSRAVSKALKAIGAAGVPQLVSVLRTGGAKARFHAAGALAKLGPDAAGAVAALAEAVENDADYSVRSNAASALGAIGAAAAAALPALRQAAGNPNEKLTHDAARAELRVRAQMAIGQIKGK